MRFPMSSGTKPLVLFDVDGTLLLTAGAGMRAMKRAAAELFGEAFRWDGIVTAGHLDTLIFAEAAALNAIADHERHHPSFRRRYLEALADELERGREGVRAMPGIHRAIERLRAEDRATLGLLTGNYPEAIPLKFGFVGLDPGWFEITAFADDAPTRAGLVEVAIAKHSEMTGRTFDPGFVMIVGDTPRDVDCAHAHGCYAFGVATGGYDVAALRAAGADRVVANLHDPEPLFEAIAELRSRHA
jgi:phosphoglycolate phosphatase-like HAD superfamily hydrolase